MIGKLKNWFLPLLFGSSVAYIVIKCYHNADALLLSAAFFAYGLLCFTVLELIRKLKIGGLLYILLAAAVLYFSAGNALRVSYSGSGGLRFDQWFYGAQTEATYVPAYSIALIAGGGFFILSVLYYFTQVRYRGFGTFLIMLFPMVIYAKRTDVLGTPELLVMLCLYVALMAHSRQANADKKISVVINRSYIVSMGAFALAATLLTWLFPKPDIVSKQEQDSGFFDTLVNTASVPDNYSNASSGTGDGLSDKMIMKVSSKYPLYLRRQAYDSYFDGRWYVDDLEDAYKIPTEPVKYNTDITNSSLIKALSDVAKDPDSGFIYPDVDMVFPEAEKITISMQNDYAAWFPPVPLNTVSVDKSVYRRTVHGEYRPPLGEDYERFSWMVSYDYYPLPGKIDELCEKLDLNFDDTLEALSYGMDMSEYDSDEYDVYNYLYNEEEFANNSFAETVGQTVPEVSDTVRELAEKVTAGLDTPYQKARALEGYFTEENFTYDPEYVPVDPSIEYFLTNSKKGACGDFATAMTLMARAVGLRARYVEGFVAMEPDPDDEGTFIVREKHSHAYTEVYIPGAGWLTFEPTVAGFLEYSAEEDTDIGEYILSLLKYLIPAAVLAAVIFIFRKQLYEGYFSVKVKLSSNEKAVVLLYNRAALKTAVLFDTDPKTVSAGQIRKMLSDINAAPDEFIDLFERTCYGLMPVTDEQRAFQLSEYRRLRRLIKAENDIKKKNLSRKYSQKA